MDIIDNLMFNKNEIDGYMRVQSGAGEINE